MHPEQAVCVVCLASHREDNKKFNLGCLMAILKIRPVGGERHAAMCGVFGEKRERVESCRIGRHHCETCEVGMKVQESYPMTASTVRCGVWGLLEPKRSKVGGGILSGSGDPGWLLYSGAAWSSIQSPPPKNNNCKK